MSDEFHKNKPAKQHYRTTNWHEYDAALTARGSLLVWFDKDMQWFSERRGKNVRPAKYSDAAISFCLSIKCLFNLLLRQSLGLVRSLLQLAHLDWEVPDHTTVCRRQRTLQVQISYRRSQGPLHLLVDSTGLQFLGEGEWKRKKHGVEYRR